MFLILGGIVQAQDQDTTWTNGGDFALTFSQTSLTNWAAGGDNALAANTLF